ncbi:MAG: peptidyl-prolyl cis-trans isomerase [Azoarcus sp.]|jgi:cyclophilin family peptidyl-prolyl cis-trans isomerase|nr:peptidyl-prolyl cis-trans isomerase [Azoarcus sp.]
MVQRLLASLALSLCAAAAQAAGPLVELKTSLGNIVLELNPEQAPKTVDNFLQYVQSGYYNGTIFHRVIDSFMIQGGGIDASFKEKRTRAPIENEASNGLSNDTGTIAMARTSDPDSATAQFFINVKNNAFLNYQGADNRGYAVFGKVISGMDVVRKIEKLPTQTKGMYANVPVEPPIIESARVIEAPPEKAQASAPAPLRTPKKPTPTPPKSRKANNP